jgi:hypothetical protein
MSTTEKLLGRKSIGSGLKTKNMAMGIIALTTQHPPSAKIGTNFAGKRWSLCRYSSLVD